MRMPDERDRRPITAGRAWLVLACLAVLGASMALEGQQPKGGRFVDRGKVVLDTTTNLVWEKKDNAGGLHDMGKTYTWCQATGNTEGLCTGAMSWIAQVNAEKFAGFSDWRAPTVKELVTIVDKNAKGCGSGSRTSGRRWRPARGSGSAS